MGKKKITLSYLSKSLLF